MGVETGSVEPDFLIVHRIESSILVLFNAPIVRTGLDAAQQLQVSMVPGDCQDQGTATSAASAAVHAVMPESSAPRLVRTGKQK